MKPSITNEDVKQAEIILEGHKTALRNLETKKALAIQELSAAQRRPEMAKQDLAKTLDAFVNGNCTEKELKAARIAVEQADQAIIELEQIIEAVNRAIQGKVVEIRSATKKFADARRFFVESVVNELASEIRAEIGLKINKLIATQSIALGDFDPDRAPALLGNLLFNIFYPHGFRLGEIQRVKEIVRHEYFEEN